MPRLTKIAQSQDHRYVYQHLYLALEQRREAFTDTVRLPVRHIRSSTHRILSLILTAAASLAFDALPPQSLDSRCELWGELETGRVACR